MDYKTHVMQAIRLIEKNLKNEIALTDCARVSGYSDYHFIRVFKEATGLTPADYIRKRRLTEIIKHMRQNVPISEMAFEYGFNSKENFTRAFITEHHILPTEYKSALNSLKLYEAISFETPPFEVLPEFTYLEPFTVKAYKSDEAYPPNFWNKYNSRKWSKKLSGGKVCEDYGISAWNEQEKKLDYFIGIRKNNALGNTGGTVELLIQGGLYAVFATPRTSHYDFVNTIHRTWDYIYSKWLQNSGYRRTGGYEFESYTEESRTFSEKIYIPYVGRYWGQEHIEKEKQLEAIKNIKSSIDRGIPAISWDIGVPEWGLIIGYDDAIQMFYTLAINAEKADPTSPAYNSVQMPYVALGKRELPILSVLTITGSSDKTKEDILHNTMKLAVNHLKGGEWCDNAKGLDAYPALIRIFDENPDIAASWNAEYFLGTYGALKEYAYKYFEKAEKADLSELYRAVFNAWMEAFKIKTNEDATSPDIRVKIVSLLKSAYKNEKEAVEIMESLTI